MPNVQCSTRFYKPDTTAVTNEIFVTYSVLTHAMVAAIYAIPYISYKYLIFLTTVITLCKCSLIKQKLNCNHLQKRSAIFDLYALVKSYSEI